MTTSRKIPVCAPKIGEREIELVSECIRSSWISHLSDYVIQFEKKFANYCDSEYGVATNSGTTALHLAVATLKIKKDDEVIIPTFTMIASPNSISYTGAKPVLVDSEKECWNIDVNKIEEKITDKTKGIMPVHTYGHPCDMDPIIKIAKKYGLYIIEDAAEAHGAEYKGKKAGSFGDLNCFSFYANKIMTMGEGGLITTNNKDLDERAKWLRAHAFGRGGKHFFHEEMGFGYRLTGIQAAFGLAQLEKIEEFVKLRRDHAKLYNDLLCNIEKAVALPPEANWAKNVYWMYSILVKNSTIRAKLMKFLEQKGIETRTFFYPVHQQPIYYTLNKANEFPIADELAQRGMNLPSGNNLSDDDIHYVCDNINNFFSSVD